MAGTEDTSALEQAAAILSAARSAVAFTGAGISVESGIPPFRGDDGLWSRYDPEFLELDYFRDNPAASWRVLKEIFYDHMAGARPNRAHAFLAELERRGRLQAVITQNIDNLHQEAGSRRVHELHGSIRDLVCLRCGERFAREAANLDQLPPLCEACGGLLKPDLVFFGELLPQEAYASAVQAAQEAAVMLIVGTLGEVQPAAMLPVIAKQGGAQIIEINLQHSHFTPRITDVFLEGKAAVTAAALAAAMGLPVPDLPARDAHHN